MIAKRRFGHVLFAMHKNDISLKQQRKLSIVIDDIIDLLPDDAAPLKSIRF